MVLPGWVRRRLGVHCYCALVHPLDDAPPAAGARGVSYALLGEEELVAHCRDADLGLRESGVRAAFRRGEVCAAALDAGRLAGYVWHAFASAPHVDGIRVDFAPRVRYAYKLYVRPRDRGRGIARELLARGARLCPRRGRTHGLSFVALDNVASLRVFAAAQWKVAGYAGYIEWFGGWRPFASAGARRLGACFARA